MLLVVLEHDRGAMAEVAREALTFGRGLAGQMGQPLHAALIGADDDGARGRGRGLWRGRLSTR